MPHCSAEAEEEPSGLTRLVPMQISRLCTIDIDDEEYFDRLWFPYLFFGCDKTSMCNVFKTCKFLHTGMQNILLAIGVLAVVLGVFWVLHTCLNELGCTEYCTNCGYYDPSLCNDSDNESEQRHGRKSDRRRKEKQCRNCVRRRNVTSSEFASHVKPERRCNSWTPARIQANFPGPDHVNPPLRLWVHANKVHIRPVADPLPVDNDVQPGEQELIPLHRRSRSRSPVATCSRVSMGSPNLYVVADSPPRLPTASRGSCRPPAFNLRSAWDSSSEEEEEEERLIPVRVS